MHVFRLGGSQSTRSAHTGPEKTRKLHIKKSQPVSRFSWFCYAVLILFMYNPGGTVESAEFLSVHAVKCLAIFFFPLRSWILYRELA